MFTLQSPLKWWLPASHCTCFSPSSRSHSFYVFLSPSPPTLLLLSIRSLLEMHRRNWTKRLLTFFLGLVEGLLCTRPFLDVNTSLNRCNHQLFQYRAKAVDCLYPSFHRAIFPISYPWTFLVHICSRSAIEGWYDDNNRRNFGMSSTNVALYQLYNRHVLPTI